MSPNQLLLMLNDVCFALFIVAPFAFIFGLPLLLEAVWASLHVAKCNFPLGCI